MERSPISDNQEERPKPRLYHIVPSDMQGTVLHPLNALKDIRPDLYVAKAGKYEDRKHIMQQFIPTLECAWNDVLHFTAVDPRELKQALVDAGMEPREMKFYEIDPSLLDPKRTTIYLYSDKTGEEKMAPEHFRTYDPENLQEHAVLPEVTKEYYKRMYAKGEKPLAFIGIPHILHKGSLDISDLPVVTV